MTVLRLPLVLLLLTAAVEVAAQQPQSIPYTGSGEAALHYFAPVPHRPPYAAVLLLHGESDPSPLARWLSQTGYAVFATGLGRGAWPEPLEDARRAVRFVRHNARRWQVDPKRIALFGVDVGGGYLANLAGVWPGQPLARAADPVDRQSAATQAVVSIAAPSDYRGWPAVPDVLASLLAPLIEARGREAALAEASPVLHLDPAAPPFLLIHGDEDREVPVVQSTHWQNALQGAGVACNLILIGGGGHDVGAWDGLRGVRDWRAEAAAWLDATLSGSRR